MSADRLRAISAHLEPSKTGEGSSKEEMTTVLRNHASLRVSLKGIVSDVRGVPINQFRGIKYGHVPGRFEISELWSSNQVQRLDPIDCTQFGPVCPQNYTPPEVLLRVPQGLEDWLTTQNEFECLNLTVTVPALPQRQKKLPVLMWIYGGSQVMTFGNIGGKLCDPHRMVAESVELNKPIIVVALNYRLNIFGFGDGSQTNLALKDQMIAVDWVRKHIEGFGGDKENITLAGESAGGVYVHAHSIVGTPIKRAILQSGSLALSPPLPPKRGQSMTSNLAKIIQKETGYTLKDVPAELLLKRLEKDGVGAMWLQATDGLEGWNSKPEAVEELMVGDCEYDSAIWRNGVESLNAEQINKSFDKIQNSSAIKSAYGIVPERSTSCKLGALDFINDYCFAMPANDIAAKWRSNGRKVYQYIVDQPNPWQSSSRSHHAVDLIFLFGGYDLSRINPKAESVGTEMRMRWIAFINGKQPWEEARRMAFGPVGNCVEIGEKEYRYRRRVSHFELLKQSSPREVVSAFAGLAMGSLSLDN